MANKERLFLIDAYALILEDTTLLLKIHVSTQKALILAQSWVL